MYAGGSYQRPRGLSVLSTAVARASYLGDDAFPNVDTQASVDALIAQLSATGQWTDKELAYINYQASALIGVPYRVDAYGVRNYRDGAGTLDVMNPGANNFSLSTGSAQQDSDNAFSDTYGPLLATPLSRYTQASDGSWGDPYVANGVRFTDNMYQAEVAIQKLVQRGDYPGIEDDIQSILDAAQAAAVPLPPVIAQPSQYLDPTTGNVVDASGAVVPGGYSATSDENNQIAAQGGGVNSAGVYVPPASSNPTVVTDPSLPAGGPVAVVPAPNTTPTTTAPLDDGSGVISASGFLSDALQQPVVLGAIAVGVYLLMRKHK